jgi:hypothetical protein
VLQKWFLLVVWKIAQADIDEKLIVKLKHALFPCL